MMGTAYTQTINANCANCGKKGGAIMGAGRWVFHGCLVCSTACGDRLHCRIESGMSPMPEGARYNMFGGHDPEPYQLRIEALRLEIKILRNRIRSDLRS